MLLLNIPIKHRLMKSLKNLLYKRENKKIMALSDKDVFYIFNRIIKEEFGSVGACRLRGEYFKNKTIFVRAESSVWGSELFSNRNSIIRKMNAELGEKAILEIKLK